MRVCVYAYKTAIKVNKQKSVYRISHSEILSVLLPLTYIATEDSIVYYNHIVGSIKQLNLIFPQRPEVNEISFA